MVALYRAGRQAEALEAYQAARRTLVDELGLESCPALQRLERAILRQDASLELSFLAVAAPALEAPRLAAPAADRPVIEVTSPVSPSWSRTLAIRASVSASRC